MKKVSKVLGLSFAVWLGAGTVFADEQRPGPVGRSLEPGGTQLVRRGLTHLAPRLVQRLRDGGPRPAEVAALGARLAALDDAALLAAYPRQAGDAGAAGQAPRFVFTEADGPSAAGEVLVRWLAEARLHGVEGVGHGVPDAVRGLAKASEGAPPLPPIEVIEAAWRASEQRADRFDGAAEALADALAGGVGEHGEELGRTARVEAEVALAQGFAALVTALPARPRTEVVLADEDGRYLSPDVSWRKAAPVDGEARAKALGAAFVAVVGGQLGPHLEGLLPAHPQYRALVEAGRELAGICAEGGWKALEAPKNDKAAKSPDAVKALQARLAREGFWKGEATGTWDAAFEEALVAVRSVRHLKEKPLYDAQLVEVLNVPCEERLETVMLNARRWRYTAWTGETESVQVNLAAQVVRYFRERALVMKQRTVVGSDKSYVSKSENRRIWPNATPILHDTIATVVVNPEWNVPPRIARDEIEPEIAKDPTYLEKKRFRVVPTAGGNIYVQASGPGNALGQIKILFPNSESVYLHDTPGRNAFKLPVRALSHGCVRVHNALDFGAELIRADRAKKGEDFDPARVKYLTRATTKTWAFQLEHEIPVFLEYYTASVDEDGVLWFHPDIYGYDAETFGRP